MGQFKPMVKMMTDEPSVILKLKKGGKVASKAAGQSEGFKSMASNNAKVFEGAESGVAPKKPSMAERRRAMNPNQYAKGGKVVKKQMGGGMPMAMPGAVPGAMPVAPAPMQAMGRQALAGMPPAKRMKRAAMVQRALAGMKKGGSMDAKCCADLEKELKHHEAMSAKRAHGKASGGAIDKDETKTTLKNSVKPYAKTKMDTAKKDRAHGTGAVKEGMPGGYAMGGSIMGNEKAYENTKMVTAKRDTARGTGGVKMGNAGGFKSGGKVPGLGNAIEGGDWENRPANSAKPGVKNTTTGGVKNGNGGGFKMGGRASKKAFATGGQVVDDGKAVKMPRHFVSRPVANSLQSGTFAKGGKVDYYTDLAKRLEKNPEKPNLRLVKTHTGPKGHVAKVYKDRDYGEHRVKFFSPEGKHYSEADYHTDDVSDAHDTAQGQLNRYKKGGKVRFAEGGSEDMSKGAYDAHYANEKAENESMRNMILDPIKSVGKHIARSFDPSGYFKGDERKKLFESQSRNILADKIKADRAAKAPGAITETEKSVTVTPRKRGGSAMC
jgi:hypothetical protein